VKPTLFLQFYHLMKTRQQAEQAYLCNDPKFIELRREYGRQMLALLEAIK